MKPLPTQEYLKECFDYDPNTGNLYWKNRPLKHFKSGQWCAAFNSRFAGKQAFTATDSKGYPFGSISNKLYRAHRVIWKWYYGTEPENILHEKGNKIDNRISKLSTGTHGKNMLDKKKQINNSSGITGVCWYERDNKWEVQIYFCGKKNYLGRFEDFFEACCVRKAAEVEYGFHPNHGKR